MYGNWQNPVPALAMAVLTAGLFVLAVVGLVLAVRALVADSLDEGS